MGQILDACSVHGDLLSRCAASTGRGSQCVPYDLPAAIELCPARRAPSQLTRSKVRHDTIATLRARDSRRLATAFQFVLEVDYPTVEHFQRFKERLEVFKAAYRAAFRTLRALTIIH
jgi:hypothetical protein